MTTPLRRTFAIVLTLAVAGGSLAIGREIRTRQVTRSLVGEPPAEPTGFPFDLTDLRVDRLDVRMGGPPKDGIPAVDDPRIVPVSDAAATGLAPDDRVVRLSIDGETRIYPVRLLLWHEIINDELAGLPISVVFCPLCDSVSVIERTLAASGDATTFGVSGQLLDSNVLLYDRASDGLWSQVEGRAISGPDAGRALRHHAGWSIESLAIATTAAPEASLVAFPDPAERPYDQDPYAGRVAELFLSPVRNADDRLPLRAPVIGVARGDETIAIELSRAASEADDDGRFRWPIGDGEIVIEAVFDKGDESTALQASRVAVISAPADAIVVHTWWFAWASLHAGTEIAGR